MPASTPYFAVVPRHTLPTLSCVIPCYNEAANLRLLLPLLAEQLSQCSRQWEVILVNDGSRDDTSEVLSEWSKRPGFRAIEFSRNFGKEAALTAGLDAAVGETVVLMDADMQHPPKLIAEMVQHWQSGADVVYALRANRDDESLFKQLGTRAFYRLMNAKSRFQVPPDAGDFRLMDRAVVNALQALPERNRFMKGLYAWVGFKSVAIPYEPAERASGVTNYSALRLLAFSIDGLTAFTTWPLRFASIVGLVLAVLAFGYGAFVTQDYIFHGNAVSGWTTIIVCLLFFVGIQLISLGILGEYIARIFEEVKNRPVYVVRRALGQGLAQDTDASASEQPRLGA
ncbi:glycosyltransferase family 2 protein [Aquabacterium sp.]|uniref:glycosyltransferase family 2 protein n=1 Tax=Aquabacterium sp. TaxID=1872578 RepID=UPI002E328C1C|nr:glycosyltransferase family 2 protein [Aquabacterium sp.]HEX5312452.1 glycosyltransferase family 2 protein [Aquabacterium sp.]